jgi:hypothetical protein
MTTALTKPIVRTVLLGDTRYKIVMTAQGVRINQHAKRRGIEVSWSSLVDLIDSKGGEVGNTKTTADTGVPQAITKDVAREIRSAITALARADDAFRVAGILPPEILNDVASDPFHPRSNQEPDWFIEPLLTAKELSSILRMPLAIVRGLGIKTVRIAGEERFRQSAVRAYLIEQETKDDRRSLTGPIQPATPLTSDHRTHPQARRFKSFYNRDR